MRKVLVYIGHKLTKADPAFIARMDHLKASLERDFVDCVFLKFLGVKAGNRADVYNQDIIKNIGSCDLFVAIVDEESTGLGIEFGAALWKCGKPILVLHYRDSHVSRLVGGAVDHNMHQIMEWGMTDYGDAAVALREAIERFKLDTLHPMEFPSFDSMLPKPPYMEETPLFRRPRSTGIEPTRFPSE